MAAKQMLFEDDARAPLAAGVVKLARAVRSTLGPRGRNAVLDKGWGSPKVTKDGVTVAQDIELDDPFENLGAQLVKEAASKTNDVAGDGTTTATVLADGIFREGLKQILAEHDDLEIVGEATNGQELLALLSSPCDVVLLDLSMPGRSGIALLTDVVAKIGSGRVIVLSMHDEHQYVIESLKAGAAGYVTKSSASQQLIQAIRKVANDEMFISATAAQSVLGKAVTVSKVRGDIVETPDGGKALVTVHPSYLLRLPDPDAQKPEYAKFIDDLKIAPHALKDLTKKDLAKKDSAQAA